MAEVTCYVALPFVAGKNGIAAGISYECFNSTAVVRRAKALSRGAGSVGPVAFSCTLNPKTGDCSEPTVIKRFGDVPDDLKWPELDDDGCHGSFWKFFRRIRIRARDAWAQDRSGFSSPNVIADFSKVYFQEASIDCPFS